jgi:uncharacterized membrane protein HdeD (DUF308 family)
MAQSTEVNLVRQASTLSILWGVLLVICGLLAIGLPFVAAFAVNVVIAWLIVTAGVLHVIVAFHSHRAGSVVWKLLVGLAYICFGTYLILYPAIGVASLTLVLAGLFLVEGVLDVVLFFRIRSVEGSGWILVDGIITLLVGGMIDMQWPASVPWTLGTLVGVSMIMSGVSRVVMSIAVRKVVAAEA